MGFATPIALILLIMVLPLIVWLGYPRYAYRRKRDISSLVLRSLIMILLVLALSGAQIIRSVDKLGVIFLLDASDSIDVNNRELQINYIKTALTHKAPEDEWGLIVFAKNAVIDTNLTRLYEMPQFGSKVTSTHTNLANAISLAMTMFPADMTGRIIILSDGNQNLGNAESSAQFAAASGIEISYVALNKEDLPDIRITNLEAPPRVNEGQEFDIKVSINSQTNTSARLLLYSGSSLLQSEEINLTSGENNFSLSQISQESGFVDFRAELLTDSAEDYFNQNNQLATFSQIVGSPRVLMIASEAAAIVNLLPTLENAGLEVDVIEPSQLAPQVSALTPYRSVILVDVPATELSKAQMESLDAFVKDLGGGLVFVGGENSYGPGGYFETVLEKTMPVETRIKDQQRLPQLTIAYLIDRSGSMAAVESSGVPNLELAKEAIIHSIKLLQTTDRAGVASFDTGGAWIAEFQDVLNTTGLSQLIATLRPGGGTDILAGLRLVEPAIIEEESERKHLIMMTDGGAAPLGIVELITELNDLYGVTTSVIAIGRTSAPFLEEVAKAGDGNYHRVENIIDIPLLLSQETVLASRSYIIEEAFTPILTANSTIMDGINSLPPLQGYIATTPKTTATVILSGQEPYSDPILATWQYGLGRVAAFTSDANGKWAADWVNWEDFPRFWGQTISWTITEGRDSNLETRVIMEGENAQVLVEARDDAGAFLNDLDLKVNILAPSGHSQTVQLQQIAPGRYAVKFTPESEGAYFLALSGEGQLNGELSQFNQVNGWVMAYSPEYISTGTNNALLNQLAELTGGSNLDAQEDTVFNHNLAPRTASAPIWHWLVWLAIFLFPFDIAVRRLLITRYDLERLRKRLRPSQQSHERTEQMATLKGAKSRARSQTASETNTEPLVINSTQSITPELRRKDSKNYQSPKVDAPPVENIGSRLLKRKDPKTPGED
ncbi:VWA domain-containing protein [Anaerolineales bacterium]